MNCGGSSVYSVPMMGVAMVTRRVAMVTTLVAMVITPVSMATAEERCVCRMIIFALFFYANLLTEPTRVAMVTRMLCSFEGVSPDFDEIFHVLWRLIQFLGILPIYNFDWIPRYFQCIMNMIFTSCTCCLGVRVKGGLYCYNIFNIAIIQ